MSSLKNNFLDSNDDMNESLVDIFTLLAIVLISASVIFGVFKSSSEKSEDRITDIALYAVETGSSIQIDIPDDEIIIIVSKARNNSILTILIGNALQIKDQHLSNKNDLFLILNNVLTESLKSHHFTIVLDTRISHPPYLSFSQILEWFNSREVTNVSTAFAK